MQNHNYIITAFILLLSLTFFNCATINTPDNYLAEAGNLNTESYGGWIEFEYNAGSNSEQLASGELIALGEDSVYIADDKLYVFAKKDITSAKMVIYDSHSHFMGGLVVLGTLSTISNGAFLLFTAPMWLIGGIISASSRNNEQVYKYPKVTFDDLALYARFPSGLPEGMDRSKIKRKR